LLDGFGGIHELGDVYRLVDFNGDGVVDAAEARIALLPYSTPDPSNLSRSDVYRDLELYVENDGTTQAKFKAMLAATGDGRVFSTRFVETDGAMTVVRNYLGSFGVRFPLPDVVSDVEFFTETPNAVAQNGGMSWTPDAADGYFMLMTDGTIYAIVDKQIPVKVAKASTNPRLNPAVDLEVVSIEQNADGSVIQINGYVLMAKGQVKELGDVRPMIGVPVSNVPVYKDMELFGDALVVADGFGHFTIATEPGAAKPNLPLPVLGFGQANVLEAFTIQVDPTVEEFDGIGFFVVTNIGTIHTSGAADRFLTDEGANRRVDLTIGETAEGYKFGMIGINFDIIRDIEAYLVPQSN